MMTSDGAPSAEDGMLSGVMYNSHILLADYNRFLRPPGRITYDSYLTKSLISGAK